MSTPELADPQWCKNRLSGVKSDHSLAESVPFCPCSSKSRFASQLSLASEHPSETHKQSSMFDYFGSSPTKEKADATCGLRSALSTGSHKRLQVYLLLFSTTSAANDRNYLSSLEGFSTPARSLCGYIPCGYPSHRVERICANREASPNREARLGGVR